MESTWASDVEIMAACGIIDGYIYFANNLYRYDGSLSRRVEWSLLRMDANPTADLCIANYDHHFTPFVTMLNLTDRTYWTQSDVNLTV